MHEYVTHITPDKEIRLELNSVNVEIIYVE